MVVSMSRLSLLMKGKNVRRYIGMRERKRVGNLKRLGLEADVKQHG